MRRTMTPRHPVTDQVSRRNRASSDFNRCGISRSRPTSTRAHHGRGLYTPAASSYICQSSVGRRGGLGDRAFHRDLGRSYTLWTALDSPGPQGPFATCPAQQIARSYPRHRVCSWRNHFPTTASGATAARGRRDEIASGNHRTYPSEHRTGDRAFGAVPECSDYRQWSGAVLSRRRPGSLLLPQLLLAGPILQMGF